MWQLSFKYIRSKKASAADLLSLISFFDRQGIPKALLKPVKGGEYARQAVGANNSDNSKYDSDSEPDDGSKDDGSEDDGSNDDGFERRCSDTKRYLSC